MCGLGRSWWLLGLRGRLDELARACRTGNADAGEGGLFLNGGERPVYADFIVAAWLQFYKATVPEWEA